MAYAVGRRTGGAVQRNRIRRRLRAAIRRTGDQLRPGTAYLVGAGAEVLTVPFDELAATLAELVTRAHRATR